MSRRIPWTRLAVAVGAVALMTLAGCASQPRRPDPVLGELNRSAASINHHLYLLDQLMQANTAHPAFAKAPKSGPLATRIVLVWDGPAKAAIQTVATMIGYHIHCLGEAPASPVTVSIHANGQSAFEVLRNIGWQSGKRLGITLEPDIKTVLVTYHRVGE